MADIFQRLNFAFRAAIQYEQWRKLLDDVPGYLQTEEAFALLNLAAHGPGQGAIVEIGSFKGRSTCWLAHGSRWAGRERVVAIDHFGGSPEHRAGAWLEVEEVAGGGSTYEAFLASLDRFDLTGHVEVMRMSSAEAARGWTRPIRLLFIDGDHSYEASAADFAAFAPHLVPGGVVCLHDVGRFKGVTRFAQELESGAADYQVRIRVLSLVCFSKRAD